MSNIRLVIVTGLSGAGKTQAIKSLEDVGFFCVDNLPPALVGKMAELLEGSEGEKVRRVALGIDLRGGEFFGHIVAALSELERRGVPYQILFLEAADEALVRRFKETRRRHPLALEGGVLEGIREERRRLQEIRGRATFILDTTDLAPQDLRRAVIELFAGDGGQGRMFVTLVSFGFKHGLPLDADLVFDVRFLPNPNYVAGLRELSGEDERVRGYVFRWPVTRAFMRRLIGLVDFLLPQYIAEGKTQLVVAIGCTGGQHRSVAVANRLADVLQRRGYTVLRQHRDLQRPPEPDPTAVAATGGGAAVHIPHGGQRPRGAS